MHYFEFFLGLIAGVILIALLMICYVAIRAVRDGSELKDDDEDK